MCDAVEADDHPVVGRRRSPVAVRVEVGAAAPTTVENLEQSYTSVLHFWQIFRVLVEGTHARLSTCLFRMGLEKVTLSHIVSL